MEKKTNKAKLADFRSPMEIQKNKTVIEKNTEIINKNHLA